MRPVYSKPPRGPSGSFPYRLRLTDHAGEISERHDPYAFPPLLTDFELHLFAEGTFFKAYETMGAHLRTVQGIAGVHFVVWAPNAVRVSVVGDFNQWDGRRHPMTNRGATGLWELFIPGLAESTLYKYEITIPTSRRAALKSRSLCRRIGTAPENRLDRPRIFLSTIGTISPG